MKEETSPVSVVAKVKKALGEGGWVEVECVASAKKEGAVMRGEWIFFEHSRLEDGERRRRPVVLWRTLEPKVVSTVNGLTAFALELDVHVPSLPLKAGQRGIWKREEFRE